MSRPNKSGREAIKVMASVQPWILTTIVGEPTIVLQAADDTTAIDNNLRCVTLHLGGIGLLMISIEHIRV